MNLLKDLLKRLFHKGATSTQDNPTTMLHLIACLGNIGAEYAETRHNIGFHIADELARAAGKTFEDKRYGFVCRIRVKNQELLVLKPSTYMNLSGNAVRYWLQKENIPVERLLVVADDLSLPFGTLRMKPGGSEAGHNGLKSISQQLSTQKYARLRFGIGNDYQRGGQIDFVLGEFSEEELSRMDERVKKAAEAVKAFALSGIDFAMNHYNGK